MKSSVYEMNTYKVDNQIVQEADNLSKETGLPFRECLSILMKAQVLELPAELELA